MARSAPTNFGSISGIRCSRKSHLPVLELFISQKKRWLWLPLAGSIAILAGFYFSSADLEFVERVSSVATLRTEALLQNPVAVLAENGFDLSIKPDALGGHAIDVFGAYTAKRCYVCLKMFN